MTGPPPSEPPDRAGSGTRSGTWRRWARFDGLGPRLVALLTVALLPLGIISLDQTRDLSVEAERRIGLSLQALTREAAAPVQRAAERALGAAGALAALAPEIVRGGPEACADLLAGFQEEGSPYAFAGLLPADGRVVCSTRGEPFDYARPERLAELLAAPRARVGAAQASALSGEDVLVVTVPYGPAGAPQGLVALSVRRDGIAAPAPVAADERPERLVVVNADGAVVEGMGFGPDAPPLEGLLPPGLRLDRATTARPRLVEMTDAAGLPHVYAVTPLIEGVVAAVGVWSEDQAEGRTGPVPAAPILFPLAMWLASLLVALWAANRLVVRPVAALGAEMRRFGATRGLPERTVPLDAPKELRDIDDAFREAAEAILRDEARMEDAFRERGVLLREIHHRVKNNLQLISSIISMQIRRAPEARTRMILRRLQDRVLTLAAIYRSLYTSADVSEASVAPVLRAIVEQEVSAQPGGVSLALDLEELVLDADKSVPLSFLVAEAVSNAVAQAAQAQGERRVGVSLRRVDGEAVVEVVNTLPPGGAVDAGRGPGLGAHLIAAFTAQLGGRAVAGAG